MMRYSTGRIVPVLLLAMACPAGAAADLVAPVDLDHMALQQYWNTRVPVVDANVITCATLIDDNLYLLDSCNRAYAVHAMTGVLRWTTQVADPGQTVRGPTHSTKYVFFTGPASVRVLDRSTGDSLVEPRHLEAVIIESSHDIATISVGKAHGVSIDDMFDVFELNELPGEPGSRIAQLRVLATERTRSKCRVIRSSRTTKVEAGARVSADLNLPITAVSLPFAASSPAVADDRNLYVGAANERIYSVEILTGMENWRVGTPKTITAEPVVYGDDLYYAGHDGKVVSCTRQHRRANWIFETEGPVFLSPVLTDKFVYVASSDRLVYCLDRAMGERVWRKRFDHPPDFAPIVSGNRLYVSVTNDGLYCLDAVTGSEIWQRPSGERFLSEIGRDVYLVQCGGASPLVRVDAATGRIKHSTVPASPDFVVSSPRDQIILLVSAFGEITCLRPREAPPLRPAALASVLQHDARAKALRAAMVPAEKREVAGERPAQPEVDYLEDDDWFGSRRTARPAGGTGRAVPTDDVGVGKPKEEAGVAEETSEEGEDSEEVTSDDEEGDTEDESADDDTSGDESEDEESDDESTDDDEDE